MNIIERNGTTLSIALDGKLDMNTSEAAHKELLENLGDAANVGLDFAGLTYISSAGIRVLLSLHKELLTRGGELTLRNVNEEVFDILDVSGFADIVNVNQ